MSVRRENRKPGSASFCGIRFVVAVVVLFGYTVETWLSREGSPRRERVG